MKRTISARRCDAHSSMVYKYRMLRMRSLPGTRLQTSRHMSSLPSTLLHRLAGWTSKSCR